MNDDELEALREIGAELTELRQQAQEIENRLDRIEAAMDDIAAEYRDTDDFDAEVVDTGTSKQSRKETKNVKDVISDLEDEYDHGAPPDAIRKRSEILFGMRPSETDHEIQKLKKMGEIYEVSEGRYRAV